MPLTHILCADRKYRSKEQRVEVALDDCLDCAKSRQNGCQFTYELLSAMFAQQQDREDRISTTTLTTKCLRSEFLKRSLPHSEQPEKLWAAFRGTMFHGQLEKHAAPGCYEEARFHVDLPGLGHLSGSPDLLDTEQGVLFDYKFTKSVPTYDYAWPDHKWQMQVNRWLVDHADYVEWNDRRWEPDQFRPKTWNELVVVYMDDSGAKPITITKSERVPTKDGKGTKSVRVPEILRDDEVYAYIEERYKTVHEAFTNLVLPPIPEGYEGWQHPLCGYCPNKGLCIDAHYGREEQVYELRRTS